MDSCDTSSANATCKDFLNGKVKDVALAVSISSVRPYTLKKGKNKGRDMAFLCVEDQTSPLDNIAIFADEWEEYRNILYEGNTVVIYGGESRKGKYRSDSSLVIERVWQI